MSAYRWIAKTLPQYIDTAVVFKYAINLSPVYWQSSGRIRNVSPDLRRIDVEIRKSWRNMNLAGSMFGGSMLSATDPIYMTQLTMILGPEFVVWDKAVKMRFRRPGHETLIAQFHWSEFEISDIKEKVLDHGETEISKEVRLITESDGVVVAEGTRLVYVASKDFYKTKQAARREARDQ